MMKVNSLSNSAAYPSPPETPKPSECESESESGQATPDFWEVIEWT